MRRLIPLVLLLSPACSEAPPSTPPEPTRAPAAQDPPTFERIPVTPIEVTDAAKAIVDAADRTEDDRKADARRHPGELLTFMGVQPGWKVADLAAGNGYTTELLVRAVGPDGKVYAQNNRAFLEKFVKESWPARLEREVNRDVVRVDREFEEPLPPEAKGLDMVAFMFSYHDVIAYGEDPARTNAAVFEALKPEGIYVIADHSARPRSGTDDTEALHRIDETTLIEQVQAAGFQLLESGDFLRKPDDDRDTVVWKVGFDTDRFVLKFIKPAV